MARRRSKRNLPDEIFDFLVSVPWWMGPVLMLGCWVLARFVMPGVVELFIDENTKPSTRQSLEMFSRLLVRSSPYAPAPVGFIWLIALIRKVMDGRRLDSQEGIQTIRKLHWREFEKLLMEAFRRQGYLVEETGPGPDGGVDMILDKGGHRTLVQAKQWRAWNVGVKIVRELFGVQAAQGADHSIVVTSGRFSADAQRFAQENNIRLIDGNELAAMIASVQRGRAETGKNLPASTASPVSSAANTAPPAATAQAKPAPQAPAATPPCPNCGQAMVQRVAKRGENVGQSFWGCPQYPKCRGTRAAG